MKKILLIAALFIETQTLYAQIDNPAFGGALHYSVIQHSGTFQSLPSVPCCSPQFSDGSGTGFSIEALYQRPIIDDKWVVSGRLGYTSYPGLFTTDEPTTVNVQGDSAAGIIHHELDASLGALMLQAMLGYRVLPRLNAHIGFSVGAVVSKSVHQTEELTKPSVGALNLPRDVVNGDFTDANGLYAGLRFGASYDFSLSKENNWFLSPELFYTLGLTSVAGDLDWNAHLFEFGIALKYSPKVPFTPSSTPIEPEKPKTKLSADAQAYGLAREDASEENLTSIRVEHIKGRTYYSLLPYVFFSEGSADIPMRYRQILAREAGGFKTDNFSDSSELSVYYDLLNIIGKRLKERPNTTITLTGCNAGSGIEKDNIALSERRAQSVRSYLSRTWTIDPERIQITSRNMPESASALGADGSAENRRVEISCSTPHILAPVVSFDTVKLVTPPIVRVHSSFVALAGIAEYSIDFMQDGRLLRSSKGSGSIPRYTDWHFDAEPGSVPRSDSPLQYSIRVTDSSGQIYSSAVKDIPVTQLDVSQRRSQTGGASEILQYTLLSSGFVNTEPGAEYSKLLSVIKPEITDNSITTIVGSTDLVGNESANQRLSENRAKGVSSALNTQSASVWGVGEQDAFDNTVPEGRFYNRAVRIRIERPLK
jgi:outer membrane protein OmpA-like peptidoglycan-associated protein